jgi:N-acetylmuramoyl-L-alanine amidase
MSKKIYINPGHSDVDPGAVGYETERKLNVKVAKYMKEYLVDNYVCQTKVTAGKNNSLSAVATEANNWKANLFVSIHFNAGGGDGYEALVYSEARKPLGKVFEKYVKEIGQNSRGVKIRSDLAVLRLTDMPAVLNEGAFVDNKKDIADWNEDAELKKMGIAYAKAAAEYLKLEKKVETPVAKPVTTTSTKRVHTVKRGESLWTIAKKYLGNGGRYPEIVKLNGLKSTVLRVGQKLTIPNK